METILTLPNSQQSGKFMKPKTALQVILKSAKLQRRSNRTWNIRNHKKICESWMIVHTLLYLKDCLPIRLVSGTVTISSSIKYFNEKHIMLYDIWKENSVWTLTYNFLDFLFKKQQQHFSRVFAIKYRAQIICHDSDHIA